MKITCIIVDDEPLAIRVLEKYIATIPYLQLIQSFDNPLAAMRFLQKARIDLIFLDINMPELSGINLVKALRKPPLIVFTTAFPNHAVQGFELDAIDYLVKPFSKERFLKAIQKVGLSLEKAPTKNTVATHLTIRADRKLYRIPFEDILYCQAYGDYVKVITSDKPLLPKTSLSKLSEQLPHDLFIRIHRSYLIAWNQVKYMEGNQVKIGDVLIPIGQQYKDQLLERLS